MTQYGSGQPPSRYSLVLLLAVGSALAVACTGGRQGARITAVSTPALPIAGSATPFSTPRISAPGAATGTANATATPIAGEPTVRVRFAVRVLYEEYVTPLDPAQLFADAWQGAADALQQAGVANVPPAPAFPHDFDAAAALHTQAFPQLERLAKGRLSDRQLTDAALHELAARRNDCHTQYLPPDLAPRAAANLRGQAKQLVGVQFSTEAPLRIVAVTPGSEAETLGLRRGQLVLAVNGQPVGDRQPAQALASVAQHNESGQPSTFTVSEPGGAPFDVTLTPQPIPLVTAVREPGNVGLLRFDTFELGDAQYQELRRDLDQFEAEGVRGWILDLRFNGGGQPPDRIAGLFVQSGLLWTVAPRNGAPEQHMAPGNALSVQRPLVIMTSRGSLSSAEILAAALQASGRATIVGEQTPGCVGEAKIEGLLDGSSLEFSVARLLIGPQQRDIAAAASPRTWPSRRTTRQRTIRSSSPRSACWSGSSSAGEARCGGGAEGPHPPSPSPVATPQVKGRSGVGRSELVRLTLRRLAPAPWDRPSLPFLASWERGDGGVRARPAEKLSASRQRRGLPHDSGAEPCAVLSTHRQATTERPGRRVAIGGRR